MIIGAKAIGFSNYDSLIFGIGMMPRGGVELVIIAIGKELGLIKEEVFSAVVFMVIASIIISPILMKYIIRAKDKHLVDADNIGN